MSSIPSTHKRAHGQFFTIGNPFFLAPFRGWFEAIPGVQDAVILEPFAGSNNLVRLMREAGYVNSWACFDIDPPSSQAEGVSVVQCDTLAHFPDGYSVVVTNPPYLARNSAARRGLPYPETVYDDLYKHALAITLDATPYVAAIIPESFINAGLFHDRLHSVVSLTGHMFDDTEHPVCLAMFSPVAPGASDFEIYSDNTRLGRHAELSAVLLPVAEGAVRWRFNDPDGEVGLRGVDGTKVASIEFVDGQTIPSSQVKHSSRAITRISGTPEDIKVPALIYTANRLLEKYRNDSKDTMMTSFKGLREDGRYRRRLDFAAARHLLDHAVAELRRMTSFPA